MAKDEKDKKRYEAPVIVQLGELAIGANECQTGSGAVSICDTGDWAGAACTTGNSAQAACKTGNSPQAACLDGHSPVNL